MPLFLDPTFGWKYFYLIINSFVKGRMGVGGLRQGQGRAPAADPSSAAIKIKGKKISIKQFFVGKPHPVSDGRAADADAVADAEAAEVRSLRSLCFSKSLDRSVVNFRLLEELSNFGGRSVILFLRCPF